MALHPEEKHLVVYAVFVLLVFEMDASRATMAGVLADIRLHIKAFAAKSNELLPALNPHVSKHNAQLCGSRSERYAQRVMHSKFTNPFQPEFG